MMKCSKSPLAKAANFASFAEQKFIQRENIGAFASKLKAEGHTIATLNGSFDLMHAGHLEIIYQAALQADVLIVALNTDASIQGYKDPRRPIIPLLYRMQMMAAVGFVDYVTSFEELDPRKLLAEIKPHVHVNGSEYGYDCIEKEVVLQGGGRLHIVNLVPGLSTSKVIDKILKTCG